VLVSNLALDDALAEEECWASGKRFRVSVGYAGSVAFFPATGEPAAALAAFKDKPFGWPPSGGHP
jgi:hypothetical protein